MERIEKQPVDLNGKAILVTGAAGFIGNNLCKRLLRETTESVIVGIDCMTDYNPIELKEWRLKDIQETFEQDGIARKNQWIFVKGDIADQALITKNVQPICICSRCKPGCTGRRPLQHYKSRSLSAQQPDRFLQHSGGMPK